MTNYEECIINLKAFVKKGRKRRRLVHDDDKHVLHIIKFTLSSLRQLFHKKIELNWIEFKKKIRQL